MPDLAPSSRWQNAFYAACALAIASLLGIAAVSLGGVSPLMELLASKPFWLYPWVLIVNPLASAILVVTILAHSIPGFRASVWSRWGSTVAVLAVLNAVLGWLLLQRVAA